MNRVYSAARLSDGDITQNFSQESAAVDYLSQKNSNNNIFLDIF